MPLTVHAALLRHEELARQRLVVCYISGLDQRKIATATTPFLAEAQSRYPLAPFTNLPSNELFPTLVTGVDPMKHGVWGTRIKPGNTRNTRRSPLEMLPDTVATTLQCLAHVSSRTYDLPAVPPRRRKEFVITRTKYKRRVKRSEALSRIGGIPTVFDIVGADRSEYFFDSSYAPERTVLPRLCDDRNVLEFVELYSLDRHQQWNSDRPDKITSYYVHIDSFLSQLNDLCRSRQWHLMIVSDHGHEPIRHSHDLRGRLARMSIPEDDYSYFLEVSNARFWFHTESARRSIVGLLRSIPAATIIRHDEMARYGLPMVDDSYGEVFAYLDPGHIFFPHDFHQPLANFWLGLIDPMQRARLRGPRHRGNHGHLPHFDAERSFALLCNDAFASRSDGTVLDIAPTVLDQLGYEPPATMAGHSLFQKRVA